MIVTIDGAAFAKMITHGAAALRVEKQAVNDLNVFPVPDGDTGTNMSLTIDAAVAALAAKNPAAVGEAAAVTAAALLRGARGNSGVILSLLFRGISRSLKEQQEIDGKKFAEALSEGVSAAYGAVMKPAEGTILTVSRLAAARAQEAAEENAALEYVLEEALKSAEVALQETIHQNPVLEKAGVIDAGGRGYVIIFGGMLDALRGKPMPEAGAVAAAAPEAERTRSQRFETEEITFGYCTEFICSRDNARDPAALRSFLDGMGDSLVLVDDDEIIKVHVHTNHPGKVLEEALTYGALLKVKIENMREQHTQIMEEAAVEEAAAAETDVIAPNEKPYGFVAVCAGEGLETVFRDLGVDGVVSGGQTMNPATEDIMKIINATPAETVFVLPNNGNIIMAAQQCIPLSEQKTVVVVETRSVPQGVAAMLAVDPEEDAQTIAQTMKEAADRVTTAQITYAARDSSIDDMDIREGDYLALVGNRLFSTDPAIETLIAALAEDAAGRNSEFITLFYGEDVTEEAAGRAQEIFEKACPNAEIAVIPGGQPVYYYLISME